MNIVFFCQSCGSRFEVPPASAGKKGRCKSCGQMMTVPKAQELASMAAMPALVAAGGSPAAAGARPSAVAAAGRPAAREAAAGKSLSWLAAATSNVALAALTVDNMRIGGARAPIKSKYDDDLGDSKPYVLANQAHSNEPVSKGRGAASGVKRLWNNQLGHVERLFRTLNQTAYLISVPFLVLIIIGASVNSRPLALFGAAAVVLLNIGRIVTGVANLAVVPFRQGLAQGIMFLIPPLTFVYLANNWKKVKKATLRIVGPIVTIAAVFLAFTFIPTLRQDGKMVKATEIKNELRREAKSFGKELIGEVEKAKSVDVEGLQKKATDAISDAAGRINSVGQPGATGKTP